MINSRQGIILKAKRSAINIIVFYVIVKQLIYVFAVGGTYWIPRGVAGVAMLLAIFSVTGCKNLSNRQVSILAPLSFALIEIVVCVVMGGDRMIYFFLIGCSLISLLFVDTVGLTVVMVLSFFSVLFVSFLTNSSLLGPGYTFIDDIYGLIGLFLIDILIFSICRYSVGSFRESQRTGEAFNVVLDTTPSLLLVINDNAEVDYISKSFAALLGISELQYAKKRPVLDLLLNDQMKMLFQEVMETEDFVEKNAELIIDGKKHWFSLRSLDMQDGSKETGTSRIIELYDITLVMEAKNEAEAATKSKSSFLANMSHEIRTPMNAIIGLIELIMLKPLDSEQLNHAVAIKGASMSLLNIINDILDFSKIDAEKMEIINKPFDFSSLINDTVNIINIKAQSAGIVFTAYISKDIPPRVNGDELRIKQILLNLLNNAVKFTAKGCVSLRVTGEFIESGDVKLNFEIKDTGMGIKKEELSKLFGAFQQVDTHKNRGIEGTGLGLSISRRLVELMGGHISVDSEYGKGSVFSFYIICQENPSGELPSLCDSGNYNVLCYEPNDYCADVFREMLDDLSVKGQVCEELTDFAKQLSKGGYTHVFFDKKAENIVKDYPAGSNLILIKDIGELGDLSANTVNRPVLTCVLAKILSGRDSAQLGTDEAGEIKLGAFRAKNVNVLLVDDNPVNLTVAEGMLRQYGMAVATTLSGAEAIEKIQTEEFDIVFMDHMMPGMDGIDATKAIRALGGRFCQVPIIALSANAISGVEELFIESGMNGFLSKPIVVKNLHETLLKYLDSEKIEIIPKKNLHGSSSF